MWYIMSPATKGLSRDVFTEWYEMNTALSPLGRPRAFDTDEALDQAMHLFWRKGFLGTSLSDLTEAMGISRPSLYAAFGNKEALFRRAVERYFQGPAVYLQDALKELTARAAVERLLQGVVDLVTDPRLPRSCLWVHGALSRGGASDRLQEEFAKQRAHGHSDLRARFKRAIAEGDLPIGTDVDALARFVQTVNFGLSVQAATGANRKELLRVVATALRAWPDLIETMKKAVPSSRGACAAG
jgi:AcrR family transcriptional regulator